VQEIDTPGYYYDPMYLSTCISLILSRAVLYLFASTTSASFPSASNKCSTNPLRISALAEVVAALPVVGDDGAVLGAAVTAADGSDHDTISSGAATAVGAAGLDGELKVRCGAAEGEALIVVILVGIAIITNGLALGVVVQGSGGSIVDVGLGIGGS
jgi:hypothetical protein